MFSLSENPLFWRGKSWGKNSENVWKSVKIVQNSETILRFSCCPLIFLWLRRVAFMTVFGGFDGFGGSGKHLALFLRVLQNTAQWGNRGGFDGFGGHGGCSHDGYPP